MFGYCFKTKEEAIQMNLRNLKNFKQGMKDLTPIQLGEGKLVGYYGMIVGLSLACINMFRNGSWGFGIFLIFLVWFQIMGLIGQKQSLKGLKDMEALQKQNEEITNDMLDDKLDADQLQ